MSDVQLPPSTHNAPAELAAPVLLDDQDLTRSQSKVDANAAAQNDDMDSDVFPQSATDVIDSEIGVTVLLGRLKQSVISANEFSSFLRKRGLIEEMHAKELQKLSKSTREGSSRKEGRQGTHISSMDGLMGLYDSMSENGLQFAYSLHTMYENLTELSAKSERQRKHWKHVSTQAEKKAKDAESLAVKAKVKYTTMADDYELVKTGDKSAGRHFFRQQNEDELRPKVEAAQQDYSSKVEASQSERRELVNLHRPSAVRAIRELITECDAGLDLQLQKFATFNEKLAVSNGMLLCPMKDPLATYQPLGLAGMMSQTNSHKDFVEYVLEYQDKLPPPVQEVQYEQHRVFAPSTQMSPRMNSAALQNSMSALSFTSPTYQPVPAARPASGKEVVSSYNNPQNELVVHQTAGSVQPTPYPQYPPQNTAAAITYPPQAIPQSQAPSYPPYPTGPRDGHALNPNRVFNIPLEEYCDRAQEYVPVLVTQCIETIKERGMETPGLYNTPIDSGRAQTLQRLADTFMNVTDNRQIVTWRDPMIFNGDVTIISELLCYWLERLPEPLIEYRYQPDCFSSITASHPILLHKTINELPNPHYATLHRITYHLRSVSNLASRNGSTIELLASRFGTLFMRPRNKADADLSIQVVLTIISKWDDFFEQDED